MVSHTNMFTFLWSHWLVLGGGFSIKSESCRMITKETETAIFIEHHGNSAATTHADTSCFFLLSTCFCMKICDVNFIIYNELFSQQECYRYRDWTLFWLLISVLKRRSENKHDCGKNEWCEGSWGISEKNTN